MTLPLVEKIAEVIRQRLDVNDWLNGAHRPEWINKDSAGDLKVTVTQGDQTPNEQLTCPGNPPALTIDQIFLINVETRPSEDEVIPIDTIRNEVAGLVRKSVCNSSHWYSMGGLAIDSILGPATATRTDSGAGIELQLMVRYRHSELDGSEQR